MIRPWDACAHIVDSPSVAGASREHRTGHSAQAGFGLDRGMEAAGIEPASTIVRRERLQAYSGIEVRPAAAPGRATARTSPSLRVPVGGGGAPPSSKPADDAGDPSRGLEGPTRYLVTRRRVRDQIPHLRFSRDFTRPPGTSACNSPRKPTVSKPVRPSSNTRNEPRNVYTRQSSGARRAVLARVPLLPRCRLVDSYISARCDGSGPKGCSERAAATPTRPVGKRLALAASSVVVAATIGWSVTISAIMRQKSSPGQRTRPEMTERDQTALARPGRKRRSPATASPSSVTRSNLATSAKPPAGTA